MEMDVQTNDKKVITEYEKPDELTMISAMAVTDDNTIAFVGQTLIPNKQERSVGSYGTINISSGKIDNHILNYIQFKYGNDIAWSQIEKIPEIRISLKLCIRVKWYYI